MKLYHLTAIPPATARLMQYGSFTAPRQQELVIASGSTIELYRLQPKQERLYPLLHTNAFAQIRDLATFRLPGTRRDYLVITSDSGSISIVSVDLASRAFIRVHCEPMGKTGCRRTVPGHLVACEPRGRACMVAALEKQKLVYVLNRDAQENLTISSPLEAHKSNTIVFSLVSLDVGFENPMFIAIERSYEANSCKTLVCYELQLGLNHVVRKLTAPTDSSSYLMFPVPGHNNGPGGVLVCSAGKVTYRNLPGEDEHGRLLSAVQAAGDEAVNDISSKEKYVLETHLPYREGTDPDSTMIVSGTVYHDKKENAFFFLLCTEYGDLIKVELSWTEEFGATQLRLVYFDTLPGPATSLVIFPSGYMTVSIEGGDMLLLLFQKVEIPDDHPAGGLSKCTIQGDAKENGDTREKMDIDQAPNGVSGRTNDLTGDDDDEREKKLQRLLFRKKGQLENLRVISRVDSLSPIFSMCSIQGDDTNSKGLLCASGSRTNGAICAIRRGISLVHIGLPENLMERPINVFTFKSAADSPFYRYIVLSFRSQTKVLVVDETNAEETTDSGFELNQPTLVAGQIAKDSLLQVHAHGVRFIPSGIADNATEWKPPAPSFVVAAACNSNQVIIALSSGNLVYFEADSESKSLLEVTKVVDALVPTGGDDTVTHGAGDAGFEPSLSILDIPPNRKKVSFFAVGDGSSQQVRLYQIESNNSIKSLGLHLAPAPIESIALVDFGIVNVDDGIRVSKEKQYMYEPLYSLVIGTKRGALVRLAIDSVTGNLSGKRTMFLGAGPVRVDALQIAGVPTCFAMGTKPWMIHPVGRRVRVSPLCADHMESASSFSLQNSPDAIVTVAGSEISFQCIDELHVREFCASALLPERMPDACVPSMISLNSSFQLSRTRTSGTPRRLIHVDQQVNKPSTSDRIPKKREKRNNFYVSMETDHMVKLIERSEQSGDMTDNGMERQQRQDSVQLRRQRLVPSDIGSWVSRLQLLRISDERDIEAEEELASTEEEGRNEEELGEKDDDDDTRGFDPFHDLNPKAVQPLDSIGILDEGECMIDVVSTHALGIEGADPDALSYIIISCAKNLTVSATSPEASKDRRRIRLSHGKTMGSLSVYKVSRSSQKLIFVHKTIVEECCFSLAPFRDMLLAGVGTTLRLYDLGKKQLLKKAEYKLAVQNRISALSTAGGDRVFVTDIQESVTVYKYSSIEQGWIHNRKSAGWRGSGSNHNREGGTFTPIASDTTSRWITCMKVIDYSTVVVCDKFGNLSILRLGKEIAAAAEESGGLEAIERGAGVVGSRCTQHKLRVEASIHLGSTASSLMLGSLRANDGENQLAKYEDEAIIYGTMDGGMGVLVPFTTRLDADWAILLEREMRNRYESIVGRDHLAYRSNFYPVKNVVDGDLCEMFTSLSWEQKESCCGKVGSNIEDVIYKLEELRNSIL